MVENKELNETKTKGNKLIITDGLRLNERKIAGNCILLLSDIQHKYNDTDFGLSNDSITVINSIVEREVIKKASDNYIKSTNNLNLSIDNYKLESGRYRLNRELSYSEDSMKQYNADFDTKFSDLKFKTLIFKIISIIFIITIFVLTLNIF